MYKLLIDSSFKLLIVALAKDNEVIDRIVYDAWQRQSELLIPEIDNIMKRNGVDKKDIDTIVLGIGPGSYTGVRIALTVAKTMAYVLKAKTYAVSSLSLFGVKDKPTIVITNARSGRSYFAVYENGKAILEDTIFENDEVLHYIEEHKDYVIAGEVSHLGLESAEFEPVYNLMLGINEEHLVKDIFKLNPVYLKDLYK